MSTLTARAYTLPAVPVEDDIEIALIMTALVKSVYGGWQYPDQIRDVDHMVRWLRANPEHASILINKQVEEEDDDDVCEQQH